MTRALCAVVLGCTLAASALAEEIPAIGLDEIHAGMTGYGESVFAGDRVERFDVEVLGVLNDVAPGTSYLLARLTGHDLERSGVIAGMSGSPVWIEGRLAGAVAFSWPFAHDAVAGITPIAAMRAIASSAPWGASPGAPLVSWNDLLRRKLPADLLDRASRRVLAASGLGAGPAVEWTLSGLDDRGLQRFARSFPALAPTAAGRSEPPAGDLRPGSSVSAVFIDGDFRMAATGTVTDRDGETLLAFGHPIAGLGEVDLPMASAEVVTILSSSLSSFKLVNTGPVIGAFVRDHSAGTLGHLGAVPHTIPLEVRIAIPTERRFEMQLADVPDLLPVLAAIGTVSSLDSATAAGGVEALDLSVTADLGRDGELHLEQSFDGAGAAGKAVQFLLAVVDFVVHNDFASPDLRGLSVRLVPFSTPRAGELVSAHASRSEVRPGDEIEVSVELRGYRGAIERRSLPVRVPADLEAGRYSLLIGDGASLDAIRFALEPPDPRTLPEALDFVRSLGNARQLAYLGVAPRQGVVTESGVLAQLPPSVRSIWSAGAPSARGLRMAIVSRGSSALEQPISGTARVDLEVQRTEVRKNNDSGSSGKGGSRKGDAR